MMEVKVIRKLAMDYRKFETRSQTYVEQSIKLGGIGMANRVRVGWIWEAVEDEPAHFYQILSDDEIVQLRRLSDRKITTRFKGQIMNHGLVRRKRRGE